MRIRHRNPAVDRHNARLLAASIRAGSDSARVTSTGRHTRVPQQREHNQHSTTATPQCRVSVNRAFPAGRSRRRSLCLSRRQRGRYGNGDKARAARSVVVAGDESAAAPRQRRVISRCRWLGCRDGRCSSRVDLTEACQVRVGSCRVACRQRWLPVSWAKEAGRSEPTPGAVELGNAGSPETEAAQRQKPTCANDRLRRVVLRI